MRLPKSYCRTIPMYSCVQFVDLPTQHLLSVVSKTLLSTGANVDTTSNIGWTALMSAARNGHLQIMKVIERIGITS